MAGTYFAGLEVDCCKNCPINGSCNKLAQRLAEVSERRDSVEHIIDTKPEVCNAIRVAGGKKMYYARKVSDGGIVTFEGKQLATSEPSLFDHLFGVYNRVVKGQQFDPKDFEIVEVVMLVCERG